MKKMSINQIAILYTQGTKSLNIYCCCDYYDAWKDMSPLFQMWGAWPHSVQGKFSST